MKNLLEKFSAYIIVGIFTALFWGVTFMMWSQAARQLGGGAPNIVLTIFALPLPFLGYWVYMSAQGEQAVFNVRTFSGAQVLALIFWAVAIWCWLQAYTWYLLVSDVTFLVMFIILLFPYTSLMRSFVHTGNQPSGIVSWGDSWLKWMGNGESHRGTLVLLVFVFWSILFWNWPNPSVRAYPTVITIPVWGLLTIFGLVLLRSFFFRQTNLPGQEVPAGDPKKSPAK